MFHLKNKMRKLFLIIPFILLFILSSCEGIFNSDDGPKLPPITKKGENTFGCKVNGEVWTPSWGAFCVSEGDELRGDIFQGNGNILYRIYAKSCIGDPGGINKFNFRIYINNNTIDSIAIEALPKNQETNITYHRINRTFKGNELNNFDFNIISGDTIDILHGTFEFDLVDTNRKATYEIREGRLDVPFEK